MDPDGLSPVGWILKLTRIGSKKSASLASKKAAVLARRQGKNVLAKSRQEAKAIERAAHGGQDLMRHQGHDLPGGGTGRPHFQTGGKYGHTFWGTAVGLVGSLLDPFDAISGELANGELPADYLRELDGYIMDNPCQK